MGPSSLASEFPNDNAEISGGAIWVCPELTGPATFEPPHFEPVPPEAFVLWFDDDEEASPTGPVELEVSSGAVEVSVRRPEIEQSDAAAETPDAEPPRAEPPRAEPPAEEPEAELDSPAFAHFEQALLAVLMDRGASRSAALLPKLLRLEALPSGALAKEVELTLQSRGYLDGHARYSQKFRDLWGAWSTVLRGASQDFAACGTTTLDRVGAELLAALLAVPTTRCDDLRRELRKAGIAAFGVLSAA